MDLRVGLLWHSLDSGNLGVRALTLAQLAILDRIASETGTRIGVMLFANPSGGALAPSTFESDRVRVIGAWQMRARDLSLGLPGLLRELRSCKLLIDIGEGDSFTDVYGDRRYAKQIASKLAVLGVGRRLVLAPQTIGPFSGKVRRRPPALILGRAEAVFVRDQASAGFAQSLCGSARIVEASDLAFRLPFERPRPREADRIRVGLNISGLLYRQSEGNRRFGLRASYPRLVRRMIEAFSARASCELHLIPHVAAKDGPDEDVETCARFVDGRPRLVLAPAFSDPRVAKSYIASMDFFVGARMHACIAAFSAGVPLLPLAYTRKATGLFGSLGYPVVGDLTTMGEEQLLHLTMETFERREALVPVMAAGNAIAGERLRVYEKHVAGLVREIRR